MVKVMEGNKVTSKKSSGTMPKKRERRSKDGDRRKVTSKGFTYISVAGWICRREQCRRKDDKLNFF
jgi:hypothetical protein